MKTTRILVALALLIIATSATLPEARASGDWNSGVGALHTGIQFGTADKAGKIVSGYFGADYALFQQGLDLGVTSFLAIGANISTKGEVLFTLTPIAFGSDHIQAGIDLIWSPGREADESPFGISIRIPLSFY
jgi:hypothetical protein